MHKRIVFILLSLVFCFPTYAHRPTAINIEPDFKNNKLTIDIAHPVANPRRHYIRKVEIFIDDREPLLYRFYFQVGDRKKFTVSVDELDKVEKIIIKAYSNRGSMREEEFNMKDFKNKGE